MKIYMVYEGHTLGYIDDANPDVFEVVARDDFGLNWVRCSVHRRGQWRPATAQDWVTFGVTDPLVEEITQFIVDSRIKS